MRGFYQTKNQQLLKEQYTKENRGIRPIFEVNVVENGGEHPKKQDACNDFNTEVNPCSKKRQVSSHGVKLLPLKQRARRHQGVDFTANLSNDSIVSDVHQHTIDKINDLSHFAFFQTTCGNR